MDLTGIGSVADLAKGIMDRFVPPKASEAERLQIEIQLQAMLNAREAALLDTQKAIIVSEMTQEDRFTKRARPTVVYAGLFFIFLVHVLFPIASHYGSGSVPDLGLPDLFWQVWGGVCAVWMVGRSAEKFGHAGPVTQAITGSRK